MHLASDGQMPLSLYKQVAFTQLVWLTVTEKWDAYVMHWINPFVTEIWWRRRTAWQNTFSLIKPFRPRNLIIEADIGMAEHRCKNTLDRSVPIKIPTDVEDNGTLEDRSPRSVCTKKAGNTCIAKIYTLTHSKQVIFLLSTVTITFVKLCFY